MSAGIFIERRFRRSRDRETGQAEESLAWRDFVHEHVVVVLGDPGLGKTTEFEHQAAREPSASFLAIRKFLRLPLDHPELQAGTLYLDGLDEARADGGKHGVLDSIIQRLIELGRPRVRLSCRAAEWFGELDRSQLADVAPSSEVTVVELQPFSDKEVEQFIRASGLPDAEAFLETVRRQRLEDWLANPQTLELMIEVARKGALPATRTGLFEAACVIMAREENRAHRQTVRTSVGIDKILDAAGFLCALELIAGLGGFAADRDESDPDFPPLEDLPSSQEELRAAVGSRLFRWSEGRATPIHRTIAEFLAARALRDRIRESLPLARVLRLITGYDGGTLSDLRGLFAWLTTLLPEHAALLAARDPAALIFYGDPEPLPADVKRAVLVALEKLAYREPWFLYDGGHLRAFGGLSDSALVHQFRAALVQKELPPGYRLAIVAALTYGRPVQELRADLLEIARKGDPEDHVRDLAIQALVNATTNESELLSWLEDLQAGRIADLDHNFRAHLLRRLYPVALGPRQIASYLIPPSARPPGDYYFFLRGGLGRQTPDEGLVDLLDGLSSAPHWSGRQDEDVWPELLGPVLVRALERYGEPAPFQQLWAWLQLSSDEFQSTLKGEHQQIVRSWFSDRPDLVARLYQWWVIEQVGSGGDLWGHDFWCALCLPDIPPDLWRWQLAMAEAWTGKPEGDALFRHAVHSALNRVGHPSLEEMFSWVERNPEYRETLEPLLVTKVRSRSPREDLDSRRKQDRAALKENLERIRNGEHVGYLKFLAVRFLNSGDPATGAAGLDRIRQEFGSEIADAAAVGFIAIVYRPNLPSPHEVAGAAARGRYFHACVPLMAGVTLLHEKGALPGLSCSGIRTALAFEFAQGTHRSVRWFDPVIEGSPAAAVGIINVAWRALLQGRAEFIPYLYQGADKALELVAKEIGLSLLQDFPRSRPSVLLQLMNMALASASREDLLTVALSQVERFKGLSREQYVLWLALLILVHPSGGLLRMKSYFARGHATAKAYELTESLESLSKAEGYSLSLASPETLAELIRLLGRACPPQSPPEGGWVGRNHPYEASRFVGQLINTLGGRLEDEAAARLRELRDDKSLAAWREKLSQTVEQQRRKIREARYRRPSLGDTIQVLQSGEPTSVADLHAVVCDHLRTLAEEIEKGPESGYQRFWNVTARGKLEAPIPENQARNLLSLLLNPKLRSYGITADPEGQYTGSNRADFRVIFRSMNVPVEIKRSDHRKVWTAPREQLKAKYSIDPGAGGFGIYLVFWFGADEGKGLPKPPPGVARPSTAAEMEAALRQIYSGEEWRDTEFLCIDCSRRSGDSRP